MLIAMMGNTYTKIAETKNEWQRQWARIVLVVERGVPPHDRLKKFNDYTQKMADGRAALILRLNMTDDEKTEMKDILEMKRIHERMSKKRQVEREARLNKLELDRQHGLEMKAKEKRYSNAQKLENAFENKCELPRCVRYKLREEESGTNKVDMGMKMYQHNLER
ncbi:CLUMA_CG006544, isoform A [Clunio marinus]|uniref:CLUMA_CG006544, isoform A n=1 Tax=Clunio marinus TaxID=568069 RepID=A0A1J1HY91_9DIPT|nr:CLUMA_CG006544, isoform A [Clunio marinus]